MWESLLSHIRASDDSRLLSVKKRPIFSLATGLFLLISTISGNQYSPSIPAAHELAGVIQANAIQLPLKGFEQRAEKELDIETMVRISFGDAPILIEVAKCESRMRQFDKRGEVFRGEANPYDVGVMQINEFYHLDRSEKLGFNIHTVEGNLGYARLLYEKEGTKPWKASKACWSKGSQIAKAN